MHVQVYMGIRRPFFYVCFCTCTLMLFGANKLVSYSLVNYLFQGVFKYIRISYITKVTPGNAQRNIKPLPQEYIQIPGENFT